MFFSDFVYILFRCLVFEFLLSNGCNVLFVYKEIILKKNSFFLEEGLI